MTPATAENSDMWESTEPVVLVRFIQPEEDDYQMRLYIL